MNIAFSVYAGNNELAVHTLSHAIKLSPKAKRNVLLLAPENHECSKVIELLKDWAEGLTIVRHESVFQWPLGKNIAWQTAARWFNEHTKEPWLWWEADAIPLKSNWLDEIEREYNMVAQDKILACPNNAGYFDGVAVYPHNVMERSFAAMLCRAAPFDQAGARDLMPHVVRSQTLVSVWDINGVTASFRDKADVQRLCNNGALFHRCKDGSLANVLSQSLFGKILAKLKPDLNTANKDKLCIIMLGRYGDIINILPVCREISERDKPPVLMVAKEFASLLDGVSYVEPEIFDGNFTDLKGALELAQSKYGQIKVAQVNSRNVGSTTQCESFTEESWRQIGFTSEYNKLPLIFDKRNQQQEQEIIAKYRKTNRPLLLVNTTGKSSPLACADALWTHLKNKWGSIYEIVDLGAIKAGRIYDLLGIMNQAACIITIDTATLHLARASSAPLISLVTEYPTQWHGTKAPADSLLVRRYSQVMDSFLEIDGCLEKCLKVGGTIPPFKLQTKWSCGQFDLPLNMQVHHFNPGLCRDGAGNLWMLVRRSQKNNLGKFDSVLVACKLNEQLQIVEQKVVDIPEKKMRYKQHEDPRVIWKNNRFYVTLCAWNRIPRFQPPKQIIAVFDKNWKYEASYQPSYGHNLHGNAGVEKNWSLFGHNGQFHFIYSFSPHIVVQLLEGTHCYPHTVLHDLKWDYGQIRGGTPPIMIGNEYLTFMHSSLPWKNGRRRYYMGVYTFEATAPFTPKKITKEPLLIGSENDTRIHGGPPVVFPCGALLENGNWLVTFGVNDEACGWIKIPHKELMQKLC